MLLMGIPGDSEDKESACNEGRSLGEENGNPPQHACLENPHGQRSLAGCSPWDHKESDTTNGLNYSQGSEIERYNTFPFIQRSKVAEQTEPVALSGT